MVILLAGSAQEESGWAPRAALGVARGWARAGHRVVLADLGLDAPALHALLGEENGEGITDALLYGSSVQRIARRPQGEKFALIPAGTPVSDPAGVLAHPRWGSLATGFREAGVILALYLPVELPGADALARRVSLRILLGPGGEGLGRAPVLARLRPAGAEPEVPVLRDAGFLPDPGDVDAAPREVEASRAPIPSIPASRLAPAPVPALHRWVGLSAPSTPGGVLTADLPEDFSPSGGQVPLVEPVESTTGPSVDEVEGPGAERDWRWESTEPPGPADEGRPSMASGEDGEGDPLDFLGFAPPVEGRDVAGEWAPPPDSGGTEFSLADPPGLWTPLEDTADLPLDRSPREEGTDPGEDATPPMEPVAPSSLLPLTPGKPGTPVAPVPTVRTPVAPPPPEPAARRRSPLALLVLLLILLLAVLGAARMGLFTLPGITPASDPGPGRAPGTSTAEAAVPVPGGGGGADATDVADAEGSEALAAVPGGDVAPSTPRHTHALALNAYTTAGGARGAAERLRAALPGHPVVIAPVEVSGRIFHRLLVAGATSTAAVASLRGEVAPAFAQGDPADWIVRDADRGFLLGEAASAEEAGARAAELERKGIPAYVLEVTLSDGSRLFRVHAGAYGSDSEASALAALLRGAGEGTPPLVPLMGRPPA